MIRVSAPQEKVSIQPAANGLHELSRVRLRLTKTTNRLQRHVAAIRNGEITPGGFECHARRPDPRPTLDYPTQGKLQTPPATCVDCAEWEPAESLRIAIIVGPDELASGLLRNQLSAQRRQRHDALVYRWQGEFTLDVIGFDAIDPKANRHGGHVDLVLLSDWILGQQVGQGTLRELERIALQTRFRFRDSYVVGLITDPDASDLEHHAFYSVERKARTKGMVVFDQVLVGPVSQSTVTGLLVSYGRSRRYAGDRSVWLTPDLGDKPLPIPKEDVPAGRS